MYAADCYTDEVQCLCNRTEYRCWIGTEGGLRTISVGLDPMILNGEEVQISKSVKSFDVVLDRWWGGGN